MLNISIYGYNTIHEYGWLKTYKWNYIKDSETNKELQNGAFQRLFARIRNPDSEMLSPPWLKHIFITKGNVKITTQQKS